MWHCWINLIAIIKLGDNSLVRLIGEHLAKERHFNSKTIFKADVKPAGSNTVLWRKHPRKGARAYIVCNVLYKIKIPLQTSLLWTLTQVDCLLYGHGFFHLIVWFDFLESRLRLWANKLKKIICVYSFFNGLWKAFSLVIRRLRYWDCFGL